MHRKGLHNFLKFRGVWPVLVLLFILSTVLIGRSLAAPTSGYTLDWWTVDAGGGSSAGGAYQLSGALAQPEGGPLAGGNYQLQGGFWQGTTYVISLPLVVK